MITEHHETTVMRLSHTPIYIEINKEESQKTKVYMVVRGEGIVATRIQLDTENTSELIIALQAAQQVLGRAS